ncbi:GAF domain-containing protein [Siccirubricoccus phaeus]|uniref:GAF domain-containing protein n=1 Tax=Siccirubricoccus phaeus TaxID=2595053 RepID=UPI0011F14C7C|nr:GAF domain-containing protein [Siccirubricoccus phaeus]
MPLAAPSPEPGTGPDRAPGPAPAPEGRPPALACETRYERLCRVAAAQLGLPMAAITLAGDTEVWVHSALGLPHLSMPRSASFCGAVIESGQPLLVPDAALDPRYAGLPLVTGPTAIRFYIGVPIRDPAGRILGSLCGLDTRPHPDAAAEQDIALLEQIAALAGEWLQQETEAARLRHRHARLEQRYRAVFDAIPLPLATIDPEGRVTAWNPAAEAVFGWRAEEAIGRFGPHVPPEQVAAAHALRAPLGQGATLVGVEVERQRRDGSRLPVALSMAPLLDGAGHADGAVVVMEDITARQEAARDAVARLERNAARTRLLTGIANAMPRAAADLPGTLRRIAEAAVAGIEGVDAGVWDLPDGGDRFLLRILVGADGAEIPQGAPKHAALAALPEAPVLTAALQAGRQLPAADALGDPRLAELRRAYLAPFGIGAVLSAPIRVGAELLGVVSACSNGPARPWTVEEQGFLASLADLAALALEAARRAAAMTALAEAAARAERASRAKSEFLAAMSQELRTPLNAILGFAALLSDAALPAVRREEYTAHITAAGRQLIGLFQDVAEQAQLEGRMPALDLAPVALPPLLDAVALAAAPEAAERGIIIGMAPAGQAAAPPALRADAARLREAVSRLLAHALRVSPPQGRVGLAARFEPGRGFCIRVEHGGPAEGPAAFEAFLAPGMLARPTGLGLPLARALVEAHGGQVLAEALPGGRQMLLARLPASLALPPAGPG